ncbi:hypothetical protein J2S43_002325 [Catenuloplanes nepalensis]|uniref:DUF1349 domain-containing protein n=1 Tax=Catenuloplanes nepalensis TaxID=587533 RepID=A0ABT9MQY7_9ACTN|nr:hypothetical protein [Catenuloplanes nepalensis]MDP9793813.1 hypothetical protein [Catenuloplanes nepalensis]
METINAALTGFRASRGTGFRASRGRLAATVAAVVIIVALGLFVASQSISSCTNGQVEIECPAPPLGPDGQPVRDKFYFVHQPLPADGSLTVRVTSMTGIVTYPPPHHDVAEVPGLVPWAKAGVIAKEGTTQGSRYVALMATAEHGVRMQHDYIHDTAGRSGAVTAEAPRWLRLTRSGDTLTGEESADGTAWSTVGTATLTGPVEIGLFVTSPNDVSVDGGVGGGTAAARLSKTTAMFDNVTLIGTAAGSGPGNWQRDDIGLGLNPDGQPHHPGSARQNGDEFTVSGNGDIGPLTGELGIGILVALIGLPIGLIVMIVVTARFATASGGVRSRGGLAAKAVVAGGVMFAAGTAAAALVVPLALEVLRANGYRQPALAIVEVARVSVGAGLLAAGAAVLAVGLAALLRRALVAAGVTVGLVVLPYLAAVFGGLPTVVADWLLRLTPAAAFAFQQVAPAYAHVEAHFAPIGGYYPLPGWAGLTVLAVWSAALLGLAANRLPRRAPASVA